MTDPCADIVAALQLHADVLKDAYDNLERAEAVHSRHAQSLAPTGLLNRCQLDRARDRVISARLALGDVAYELLK